MATQLPEDMAQSLRTFVHSVNNHLATISGQAQMILMRLQRAGIPDELLGDVAERVGRIRNAVERCEGLLGRYRALYHSEPRRSLPTSIRFLVEQALERIEKEDVQRVHVGELPCLAVCVDPEGVGTALGEAVHNALLASPADCTISIEILEDESSVQVTVTDAGMGAEPEVLARAFELWYSAWPEQRRTGLGLAIAQRFLEEAGGSISLESEGPGKGARCILRLPRAGQKGNQCGIGDGGR